MKFHNCFVSRKSSRTNFHGIAYLHSTSRYNTFWYSFHFENLRTSTAVEEYLPRKQHQLSQFRCVYIVEMITEVDRQQIWLDATVRFVPPVQIFPPVYMVFFTDFLTDFLSGFRLRPFRIHGALWQQSPMFVKTKTVRRRNYLANKHDTWFISVMWSFENQKESDRWKRLQLESKVSQQWKLPISFKRVLLEGFETVFSLGWRVAASLDKCTLSVLVSSM